MIDTVNDADLRDRMHRIVSRVLTDKQIIAGVGLTDAGFEKIATKLAIEVNEARALFNALRAYVETECERLEEMQKDLSGRFAHEPDFFGNVTVRDQEADKEIFLRGSKAAKLLKRLKSEDEQSVLASVEPMMENDEEHQETLDRTGFWGKAGAGCLVMAKSTGRILIAHRGRSVEQPGTWGTWGGAIDEGEDPVDACLREIEEEAGYTGGVAAVLPLYVFQKDNFRYSNFLVVVADEFKPRLDWENQGYQWCEIGQWPSPLHFGLKALLADPKSMATITKAVGETQTVTETVDLDEEETFESEMAARAGFLQLHVEDRGRSGHRHRALQRQGIRLQDQGSQRPGSSRRRGHRHVAEDAGRDREAGHRLHRERVNARH
jgi:8-oxo-dGTP pyrophosphatase MutT (NUDIX family)